MGSCEKMVCVMVGFTYHMKIGKRPANASAIFYDSRPNTGRGNKPKNANPAQPNITA